MFEILSKDSGRRDRIEKVREYAAVASIRSYIIMESTSVGLFVLQRPDGRTDWIARTLTEPDTLTLPELGLEIPVLELYEDITFDPSDKP